MSDLPTTCDRAIEAFIARVRVDATLGPVAWLMALFVQDTAGWRTIVIDPDGQNDLDGDIIWAVNRMARIFGAPAAAFADEDRENGAIVYVERRGATHAEIYSLGRGAAPVAQPTKALTTFEIVPGGDPNDGWGWQDHDSLELDVEPPDSRPASQGDAGEER